MNSLILIVALISTSAFAANYETETRGRCQFHTYAAGGHIAFRHEVHFKLPNTHTFIDRPAGREHNVTIGVGTADVQTQMPMMGVDRKVSVKPIKIKVSVTLSEDGLTKRLHGSVDMYNIFERKMEKISEVVPFSGPAPVDKAFDYFQGGFQRAGKVPAGEISSLLVFCDLEQGFPRN